MDCSLQGCAYAQVSVLYLEFTAALQAEGFCSPVFSTALTSSRPSICSDSCRQPEILLSLPGTAEFTMALKGPCECPEALWRFMWLGSFLCVAGFCSVWPDFQSGRLMSDQSHAVMFSDTAEELIACS